MEKPSWDSPSSLPWPVPYVLRVVLVAHDARRRARLADGIASYGYAVLPMASADVDKAVEFGPLAAVVDLVSDPAGGLAAAKALRFVPGGSQGIRPLGGLPIVALSADETWRSRLKSDVPAVLTATDASLPGELWNLRRWVPG